MQVLLDTHIVLAAIEERLDRLPDNIHRLLADPGPSIWVSVTSLWEVEIKSRIGKLAVPIPLRQWPDALFLLGAQLIGIEFQHVVAEIGPEPPTKDPFDRLLLGVCAAENLQLVTVDRALAAHPLAWRDIPLKNK